ncbi:hypothetical protein AVEN_170352-1 [Araneus ventricosus]|uniref:Uncharacterized protein n=1 Tax=Araneus ventricosus TaxID=182803 RepID=A0A4Y2CBD5_ARAVE|nr:hypothetical protein AVEN_170352-1 [Araneus ventricosus]
MSLHRCWDKGGRRVKVPPALFCEIDVLMLPSNSITYPETEPFGFKCLRILRPKAIMGRKLFKATFSLWEKTRFRWEGRRMMKARVFCFGVINCFASGVIFLHESQKEE